MIGDLQRRMGRLDAADVNADDIAVREPTLDDVFLALTGQEIPLDEAEEQTGDHEEVRA